MSPLFRSLFRASSLALALGVFGLAPSVVLAAPPTSSSCAKSPLSGRLNINSATAEQWILLPGIGPATAQKLLAYHQRHAFSRLSQLMRVKGIGKKTFARLKPFLTLDGETTLTRGGP